LLTIVICSDSDRTPSSTVGRYLVRFKNDAKFRVVASPEGARVQKRRKTLEAVGFEDRWDMKV
jgi:hypothetical protein